MLNRLWLWFGRWLGKLLLLLLIVGLSAWGMGTAYYSWKFSGPVSSEEQIPSGEAALTQGIIEDAIRVVEQHRDSSLRHGVFSQPGKTWQAWVRLSNGNAYPQFDRARDARGMALKLLDVPGEKLLSSPAHTSE